MPVALADIACFGDWWYPGEGCEHVCEGRQVRRSWAAWHSDEQDETVRLANQCPSRCS